MKIKYIIAIIIIALIIATGILILINEPEKETAKIPSLNETEKIIVKDNFGNKIVYESGENLTLTDYQNDCVSRKGTFNECGSPCSSEAEVCIMMCAFTCENLS